MAQEEEAKESFEQLEMLKRTHDKLRTRAEELESIHDRLFSELEIVKKTLLVRFSTQNFPNPGSTGHTAVPSSI